MTTNKPETVGSLIEALAKYPFSTEIVTECCACQKSSSGGTIKVNDHTNQTFGYLGLEVNRSYIESQELKSEKQKGKYAQKVIEDLDARLSHMWGLSIGDTVDELQKIYKIVSNAKGKLDRYETE